VPEKRILVAARNVQVVTDDVKILTAKVIGTDSKSDLALIKVDGNDFSFVKFAEYDPRIGDWVIAVGNPFGLGGTAPPTSPTALASRRRKARSSTRRKRQPGRQGGDHGW